MNPLEILLSHGEVTETVVRQVEQTAKDSNRSIEAVLLDQGVSKDSVRKAYSEYFQVPFFIIPDNFTIAEEILSYIPEESAVHYKLIPLMLDNEVLVVGVNDPDDLQIKEVLNFVSTKYNIAYKLVFMLEDDILEVQRFYDNLKGEVTDALETLEGELNAEIAAEVEESSGEDIKAMEHIEEDAPVTKIVATILRYAVDGSASDIHVEPNEVKVIVRFRVDGVLTTSLELPKNVHMAVVARIKILSSMRLDERRKPQDGRFSATFDGRKIDFRVSVLPTNHGEKVVMRILDNEKGIRSLEEVGISPHLLNIVRNAIKEPYGIILISGPTGSGKSTTLYAMLSEVDRLTKNVLSLEDPVEYNIDGVSQSQVRPEIGYTFANGLRAALRQDPDIIMVGEIRDRETAQLAIQAALTGHLVLSTIHTNNAIGVIPRLVDMGIDPYLIAPTLRLAIAQRLARRVCSESGRVESVGPSTQIMIDEAFKTLPQKYLNRVPENRTIIYPEPSPGCATGLKGRVAVMEAFEVNEEIQDLILGNASEDQIYQVARRHGFMSMKEDAIIKALEHVIPYEEMNAFGTKIGVDSDLDEMAGTVDNQVITDVSTDIMDINEDITG
ncbi:MAG: Flp pilus assembly complex ATPase component TadA [Candidatus Nomurabacteria bacterium]|nr:MAG: Flp pilus assembly complex ATPase component TadA [Candidatus Nomurabacteria bacterium]